MNWAEVLTILIPMIGGLGWIIARMDRKFDQTSSQIANVDQRISRLEGYMLGRESLLKIKGE